MISLSTASASSRCESARIRNAITTKITHGELTRARLPALEWVLPSR
jgi:hypothetical protein